MAHAIVVAVHEQVRVKVVMEEEEVSKQAAAVATLQAEAQRELDRALPALQAAERALDSLTKADITEVKVRHAALNNHG
jgi:dynein heavy chain